MSKFFSNEYIDHKDLRKCSQCKMQEPLYEGDTEYDDEKQKYIFICKYCMKLKKTS